MQKSVFSTHLGTDAQRSAWIIFLVVSIVLAECVNAFIGAKSYYVSSALYVLGPSLGFWGCAIFVKASYPDQIVSSCFYTNQSIEPPEGSWWCRVHFGTRVLRGGQLQLLGAMFYALASAVWIQEDFLYKEQMAKDATSSLEYIDIVFSNFLLVSGCVYQLLGQYPQSVLKRGQSAGGVPSSWLATDLQVSGWYFETLSILWLLRSAIEFDQSTAGPEPAKEGEEAPSVPWNEYDWSAFGNCWLSFLMAVGSYFVLAQAYREGTRMDAVLIQQAMKAATQQQQPDLEESLVEPSIAEEQRPPQPSTSVPSKPAVVRAPVPQNPLKGVRDLSDSRTVLRRARKLTNDLSEWVPGPSPRDVSVWLHVSAHAVRFETNRFSSIDPLLLAAIYQSESF